MVTHIRVEESALMSSHNGRARRLWADGRRSHSRLVARVSILAASLALIGAVLFSVAPVARATLPEFLTQAPEDGIADNTAGRLSSPYDVAVDPNLPGNVYVADHGNNRVDVFSPWGSFVRAFGWGVVDGEAKLEACTQATGCLVGLSGAGAGEIDQPSGLATDSTGDLYVVEGQPNYRVQKFDPEGHFLFMFGGEVNNTAVEKGRPTEENVCPFSGHPTDICQGGTQGSTVSQLGSTYYFNRVAVSPLDGTLFLGEDERIQEFNPDGAYKEEIAIPGKVVQALVADKEGSLYAVFLNSGNGYEEEAHKLSPNGPAEKFLSPSFAVEHPEEATSARGKELVQAVAVDPSGIVYLKIFTQRTAEKSEKIQELRPNGECFDCGESGEGSLSGFARPLDNSQLNSIALGNACGPTDIYISHEGVGNAYLSIYGPHPDTTSCPPPVQPPEIDAQYAVSVDRDSAELRAQINPKFWSDTRYYVEYGVSACSEGGCAAQPSTPGSLLTTGVVSSPLTTPTVLLSGLTPGKTYHYRFVAASSGGGPVYGEDHLFNTFSQSGVPQSCPVNEGLRTGLSAVLPDCRAYEMVSPVDKEGSDIAPLRESPTSLPASLDESAAGGDRFTYGSSRAFGDAQSAPYNSQYMAARNAGGWASHAISPSRKRNVGKVAGAQEDEFRVFSPDLCQAWLRNVSEPTLAPGAVEGTDNLYRRQDNECGGETYEPVTKVRPPHNGGGLAIEGVSEDGFAAIYGESDNLTKDAPNLKGNGLALYYQRSGEEEPPVYVCFLPDGKAVTSGCSAGTVASGNAATISRYSSLHNAMSGDGSRVYWSAYSTSFSLSGPIYLRENPGKPQSVLSGGVCVEVEQACTLAVSQEAETESPGTGSQFWGAAKDGSKAIFTVDKGLNGGDLYEFDATEAKDTLIAHKVLGVMGTSEDASYVYFASREALAGSNPVGATPVAGRSNLYLYHDNEFDFIATLSGPLNNVALRPSERNSRVAGDGLHVVFMSPASLTGYDNVDVASGKPDAEVYMYDAPTGAGGDELRCVSCNPSGARPVGSNLGKTDNEFAGTGEFWVASRIPVWPSSLYASRVLSDDGRRVFLESTNALTPNDSNGLQDVYEWEAEGSEGCSKGSVTYSKLNEGCVALISSGQNGQPAEFIDASPDGNDVFFTTGASLVSQDTGLLDIYDARVDGGFPPLPPPPAACEGEACQNPPAPPIDLTPGSLTFSGIGDLLAETKPIVRPKTKPTPRAQKLAAALKRCASQPKRKRARCRSQARKRYALKQEVKATNVKRRAGQ